MVQEPLTHQHKLLYAFSMQQSNMHCGH